jgi:hypothetical protein
MTIEDNIALLERVSMLRNIGSPSLARRRASYGAVSADCPSRSTDSA